MTTTPDRLRLLHGTEAPLPELRPLRAGPVSLLLEAAVLAPQAAQLLALVGGQAVAALTRVELDLLGPVPK